nr:MULTISPECIES: glycoside hydrolase family 25 protein [unclassified Adlercreutzia]
MGTCAAESPRATGPSAAFVSDKMYDWANLRDVGGRLVYEEGGQVTSRAGIDVSEHQGYIDWEAVAADGIDFAMVRAGSRGATEGGLAVDDYFAYNLDGATRAGLDVGVYFFSQAATEQEAVEEADFVLELLGGAALSYPVAYDHERIAGISGRADALTPEQMTANARAFCDRIAQAGYAAMIYGNAGDLARYQLAELGGYGVWFAEYGVSAPKRNRDLAIWQYSNEGRVAGIDTVVDLDIRLAG